MKKNRKYGLIGKNIDYSFSKKFFSEKFEKENLNCIYSNFDIENISHVKLILQDDAINGFNVTIPYKEEIIKFLDEIDKAAKTIGAVNTIKKINNKYIGFNTDFIGFDHLTIVDISFFCDFSQFLREGHYEDDLKNKGFNLISENFVLDYPKTYNHLMQLSKLDEFSSVIGTYLDWYKRKLQESN